MAEEPRTSGPRGRPRRPGPPGPEASLAPATPLPPTHPARPGPARRTRSGLTLPLLGLALVALLLPPSPAARAQDNPVFVDDSTLASDVLAGLPALLASDNTGEAVRLLQRLLDEEADRLVPTPGDPDLLEPVRDRVQRVLLENEPLLARYRTVETERASALLAGGRADEAERSRLLTAPGFDAAVLVASDHLASGRFEAARIALEQLEQHPDRDDPARAGAAAGVWSRLSAYLARAPVIDAARRWSARAGEPFEAPDPVPWPPALTAPAYSPAHAGEGFEPGELLDTPLCSTELREAAPEPAEDEPVGRRSRPMAEYPYLFPLVTDDTVYATDGLWVGAWDRFTLTPRWRIKPRGADNERDQLEELYAADAYRRNRSRDVEEATALSLHGRLLLGATGLVSDGGRQGDPRLHAFDARTGRVLWSSYIDELDPQLDESASRGPAVFEGDTAVVAVRKISQTRRFASAYLVGVDLADGSARWVRLSGSAGWLAYGGRGQWTDWPEIHEGVVYRVDELGVVCAVEAGSGRFRWVLRLHGVESRTPGSRLPWAASRVVIDGQTLLALSPDRRELLRIDLATGRILARRDTQPLGMPGYIFRHGDTLVGVGAATQTSPARVAALPVDRAETAPVRLSPPFSDPGILGRVVASGGSLLVPLQNGLQVLDLATLEPAESVAITAPGNLVPLGRQLIAADNQRLHSYLVWDDASALLRAKLDADPRDLGSAVSFAELAHRAGRPGEMLAPIDAAIGAMAADPLDPRVAPGQARLFGLLATAVRDALASPELGVAPPTLDGMTERMGLLAATPDQRATHLLARSRVHERLGRVDRAVADCQAILADPALAGAVWERDASSVRAEIDALARLDRLLAEHGRAPYAPFEQAAADKLAGVNAAGAEPLETLARAYPRTQAALRAWLLAAARRADAGETLALDRALDRGLSAAASMRAVGIEPDPEPVAELLGRRLTALVGANRLDTAAELLESSAAQWRGLTPTADGRPLDRAALAGTLRARAEARGRRPVIADAPQGRPTLIEGWVLMRALDRRDAFAARPGVLMLGADRLALWNAPGPAGPPAPAWVRDAPVKPTLIRFDPERILLYTPDDQGGSLVALDPARGGELWRVERLAEVLARARGPAAVAGLERFETPVDGEVGASEIVLVLDEATIAIVSRSGRVAGVDLTSGRVAWATRSDCQQVADAAAGEGVLAIGGVGTPRTGDAAGEPLITVLDLASGEEISRYAPAGEGPSGRVRWLHVVAGGRRVVAGLSRGLVSLSLPDTQPEWTLTDMALEQTSGAWAAGQRLLVQSSLRELALVDAAAGELLVPRLDTADCLQAGEPIDAQAAAADASRLAVLSPGGYALLDTRTGALLASDAIGLIAGNMVQPAITDRRLVLVEREPIAGAPGLYRIHILDTESGRAASTTTLALTDRPRRVAVLDGSVWITAGDGTVVVPAE